MTNKEQGTTNERLRTSNERRTNVDGTILEASTFKFLLICLNEPKLSPRAPTKFNFSIFDLDDDHLLHLHCLHRMSSFRPLQVHFMGTSTLCRCEHATIALPFGLEVSFHGTLPNGLLQSSIVSPIQIYFPHVFTSKSKAHRHCNHATGPHCATYLPCYPPRAADSC